MVKHPPPPPEAPRRSPAAPLMDRTSAPRSIFRGTEASEGAGPGVGPDICASGVLPVGFADQANFCSRAELTWRPCPCRRPN